jgi:hypothetical protein
MRALSLLLVSLSFTTAFGQRVLDTLSTLDGTMIIYANRTWEYIEDQNFNGILNPQLHALVMADTNIRVTAPWNHEYCYSSNLSNDISKLRDTFWLCLQDHYTNAFVRPCKGIVTSGYGWRHGRNHNGTDLDLNTGDTVVAAWPGKVRYSKYNEGGFGNLVVIRHFNGLETFYAHLSKLLVAPNQLVEAGEPIGLGGNTGHSYGSHLHFEVRFYDIPIDSEKLIDYEAGKVRDENLMVHRGLFGMGGVSASSAAVASTQSTHGASDAAYYRIRSGDTLGEIARRNRTTVSKLCQLNGIRPTAVLQIGRNIRIR